MGYRLVFRGEVLEGQDRSAVAQRLAALLKLDAPKVKALFSGKPVVLKRDVPKDVAARYQAAFRDAGARLRVSATAAEGAERQGAPAARPTLAQRLAAQEAANEPPEASSPAAADANPGAAPGRPIQAMLPEHVTGGVAWSVAPAEGDLLDDAERQRAPAVAVDVSHLSAAPAGSGSLQDVLPKSPPPPPAPDTSHLELDAPGADLAPPLSLPQVELALDYLTLAEPGADLGEERSESLPLPIPEPGFDLAPAGADLETLADEPPPPPPDVSHLKVE